MAKTFNYVCIYYAYIKLSPFQRTTTTTFEPELVTKRRIRITCGNCGHSWLSETQTAKRTSCSKCKTSITLPTNLRPTSPHSLHPELIVFIDKAWTAARDKNIMFLDQLFNNPTLTRAQKLQKYAEHFRDVANDKVLDDVPNTRADLLKRADYYEKLASSPTVDSEPNPTYDATTNSIKNLKTLVTSGSWSSNKKVAERLLQYRKKQQQHRRQRR